MNNLFSIEGKTALVTGGSRGIGEMIAAGFLDYGAKVYISSRKAEACVRDHESDLAVLRRAQREPQLGTRRQELRPGTPGLCDRQISSR